MVLLADYGAGKSTSVEHLKDLAADRYLSKPGERIPVLFRLRDLRDDLDMRTFIEQTCSREIGQPITDALFWEEAANSGFLILLDGFDEITLNANEQIRAELMQRLQPLLYSPCPSVLTSRPSYFLDASEYKAALAQRRAGVPADSDSQAGLGPSRFVEGLLDKLVPDEVGGSPFVNYDIYELELLDSDQINSYLESYRDEFAEVGAGEPTAVRAFLDSVYDLSDLVRRPFILRMVVETVLAGRINVQNETVTFGPAALYQAYAETTVMADFRKAPSRRQSLSIAQRLDFAEACARHMQQHTKEVLTKDDLAPVLAVAKIPTTDDTFESVLTDLRTCSFLSITDSGHLRFIHRSFQEFFMARHLKAAFDNQRLNSLDAPLGWEILYFFGAFAVEDPEFHERLGQAIRGRSQQTQPDGNSSELVLSNMATGYLYGKERVTNCDWRQVSVQHLQRPRTIIAKSTLDHVVFASIEGTSVTFEACHLDDVAATLSVDTASFVDCRGSWSIHGSADTVALSETEGSVFVGANVRRVTQSGGASKLSLTSVDETIVDLADTEVDFLDARRVRIDATRSRIDLGPLSDGSHVEGVIERSRLAVPDHARLTLRSSMFDGITIATVRNARANLDRNVATDRAHPVRSSTFDRGALLAHSVVNWDDSMPDHDGTLIVGGHIYHKLGDRKWRGLVFKEAPPQPRGNGFCRVVGVNPGALALVEGTGQTFHESRRRFDREVIGVKPDSGSHLVAELAKWFATIDGADAASFVLEALSSADLSG